MKQKFIYFISIIFESNFPMHVIQKSKSIYSKYFKEKYLTINFSKVETPYNWYLDYENEEFYFLVGPSMSFLNELQFMTVAKNNIGIKKEYYHMDNKYCLDSEVRKIESFTNFIDGNITKKIKFSSEILFCKKSIENNKSYVAYFNKALLSLIVIQPYEKNSKNKYIEFFESLKYMTNKNDLPSWLFNQKEK